MTARCKRCRGPNTLGPRDLRSWPGRVPRLTQRGYAGYRLSRGSLLSFDVASCTDGLQRSRVPVISATRSVLWLAVFQNCWCRPSNCLQSPDQPFATVCRTTWSLLRLCRPENVLVPASFPEIIIDNPYLTPPPSVDPEKRLKCDFITWTHTYIHTNLYSTKFIKCQKSWERIWGADHSKKSWLIENWFWRSLTLNILRHFTTYSYRVGSLTTTDHCCLIGKYRYILTSDNQENSYSALRFAPVPNTTASCTRTDRLQVCQKH